MSLEFDHLFLFVDDPTGAASALTRAGWWLDEGSDHRGQGTHNRQLVWPE